MRPWPWVISVSLVGSTLCGCNAIFGLTSTHEQDAALFEAGEGPGIDTPVIRGVEITQLTYDNADGAHPTTDQSELATDPNVRVALGTDPLSAPLPYMNKIVATPREYDNMDWRLVATIDNVTQEWQWRVGDGAHLTSMIDARNPAKPSVPAGSSIEWGNIPQPAAGPLKEVLVTTTGGWMHDRVSSTTSAMATTFDWTVPAGGVAPTAAHGDVELLTVLPSTPDVDHGCFLPKAVGAQSVDLVAGTHTDASQTAWNTTTTSTWTGPKLGAIGINRLHAVLDGRYAGAMDTTWQQAGYVMRGSIPAFNPAPDLAYSKVLNNARGHLRHPQMVDVLSCTATGSSAPITFLAPPASAGLDAKMDKVWYAEITNSRGGSQELTSMLQAINVVPGNDVTMAPTVAFATPLARDIVLDAGSATPVDLQANASDLAFALTLGPTHRLIPLTWNYETGSLGVLSAPDDVTVYVYGYKVDVFIQLTLVREIHVTTNSALIDSDAFANRAQYQGYMIEIVGRNSTDAARVKAGDYTGTGYPLSAASVFTYAFKVQ